MDSQSLDSETSESLDYLCPPITRTLYENKTIKEYNTRYNIYNITEENSSTCELDSDFLPSLTLKENCGRKVIVQQSGTPKIKENKQVKPRPLIKVTVIPTSHRVASGSHKRKKHKKVHRTVSNEEGNIQKQHVYLVVAGKNKDKFYKIKATESAKFSNRQNSHQSYDIIHNSHPLRHLKQIFNYKVMDKKKKKKDLYDDPRCDVPSKQYPLKSNKIRASTNSDVLRDCICTPSKRESESDDSKNRIKIFGRIGLTEDDKYVLKCEATVNDEPIDTENLSPDSLFMLPLRIKSPKSNSNSLGIQVDISNSSAQKENKHDRKIQCNCVNTIDDSTYISELESNEDKATLLTKRKSPIVIISVYPNIDEDELGEKNKDYSRLPVITHTILNNSKPKIFSVVGETGKQKSSTLSKFKTDQNYARLNRSGVEKRSAGSIGSALSEQTTSERDLRKHLSSPREFITKNVQRRDINTKSPQREIGRKNSPIGNFRGQSPLRDTPMRNIVTKEKSIKSQTQDKLRRNINKNTEVKTKIRKKGIGESKTSNRKPLQLDVPAKTPLRRDFSNKMSGKNSRNNDVKRKEDMATNTFNSDETKKSIIESFTNQYSSSSQENNKNQHSVSTKSNTSNVSINIEGSKESYDVIFHQDDAITDVRIRKTMKDKPIKHVSYDDGPILKQDSKGKEKLNKQLSKSIFNQHDEASLGNEGGSKLSLIAKLRDSVQIFHQKLPKESNRITTSSEHTGLSKHFRGDECSVPDPLERDKEIRNLLGVQRYACCGDNDNINMLFEKGVTLSNEEIDFEPKYSKCVSKERIHDNETAYDNEISTPNICSALIELPPKWISKSQNMVSTIAENTLYMSAVEGPRKRLTTISTGTQYYSIMEQSSLYQQLVLNSNIQVFLHVDNERKHNPIILTRKQYDRIKRKIQQTLSQRSQDRYSYISKRSSVVFVGEIRRKAKKSLIIYKHKQTQTEDISNVIVVIQTPPQNTVVSNIESQTQTYFFNEKPNFVYSQNKDNCEAIKKTNEISPRQAVSSMEVQYASVCYNMKHVTFSTTNIEEPKQKPILERLVDGASLPVLTLFKGHKKSLTPNLGTSMYSLYPEGGSSEKSIRIQEPNSKSKKPFLRRLMSCLVMRSENLSDIKADIGPPPLTSVTSSIDSYHISTSLGALEVTSSMYDTSESFFSNHTIFSLNNSKIKRGFLGSVWGFLNRKS